MNAYVKQFTLPQDAREEYDGYVYFASYFPSLPQLLETNIEAGQLTFEHIDPTVCTVTDVLKNNHTVDLSDLFTKLANITITHAAIRHSEGGTVKFFVRRIERITPEVISTYEKWVRQHPSITVNSRHIETRADLMKQTLASAHSFTHGLCAPSQGDLHERNIFVDGTVVDFEAAGWNLIATDVATFLWHTLFVGNYFGPRYAKWATHEDRVEAEATSPQLITSGDTITIQLNEARSSLTRQYLEHFLKPILALDDTLEQELTTAMCFRLFTTFAVLELSEEDRHLAFSLANYLASAGTLTVLDDILNR